MAARLDIPLRRNEDWARSFNLADNKGLPINISGWTIELDVKDLLVANSVLYTAYIDVTDSAAGQFDVVISTNGTPLGSFGNPLWTYRLLFDLRVTDGDGIRVDLVAGEIVLSRGISQ